LAHRKSFLPLLAVIACTPQVDTLEPVAQPLDAIAVEGVLLTNRRGVSPVQAEIRAINAWGAAISAPGVTINVDGLPTDITFNDRGSAFLTFDTPGNHTLEYNGQEAVVSVTGRAWGGIDADILRPSTSEPSLEVQPYGRGLLARTATALYWIDEHSVPTKVMSPQSGDEILGMKIAQLDADGVPDVVAWTQDSLVFLRAIDDGAPFWASGFRASARKLTDVDAADLNRDDIADLAVAWDDGGEPLIELLQNDGLWNFTVAEVVQTARRPMQVALGHRVDTVQNQLTVLEEGGEWEHFTTADDGFFEIFSSTAPTTFIEGSELIGGIDVHNDGIDEVIVVSPLDPGNPRPVHVVDSADRPLKFVSLSPMSSQVAIADGTADGRPDLWMLDEDGTLHVLSYMQAQYRETPNGKDFSPGPFSVLPQEDGPPSLLIQGETWWHEHKGTQTPDGTWNRRGIPLDNLHNDILWIQGLGASEDGSGVRWVVVQERDGVTWFKLWQRTYGESKVVEQTRARLAEGAVGLDDIAFVEILFWRHKFESQAMLRHYEGCCFLFSKRNMFFLIFFCFVTDASAAARRERGSGKRMGSD